MTPRRCAHPTGCDLLAARDDIYCAGCASDPSLDLAIEDSPAIDFPIHLEGEDLAQWSAT